MVMVGPELNIRRFTPLASMVLGLAASDVGRPITRLRLKLVVAGYLRETMLNVIAEVCPSHQRLDPEGRWCELRVTPYRTSDDRIDGVVLSVLTPKDSNHADAIAPVDGGAAARKKTKAKPNAKKAKRRQGMSGSIRKLQDVLRMIADGRRDRRLRTGIPTH